MKTFVNLIAVALAAAMLLGGTVHADANGRLSISVAQIEDSPGNSLLKVSTYSGAILALEFACNSLIGCNETCLEYTEVEVLKGTFTFQQSFVTEDTLTMQTGGRMVVPDGTSGSFDVDPSTCTQ